MFPTGRLVAKGRDQLGVLCARQRAIEFTIITQPAQKVGQRVAMFLSAFR